MPIRSNPSLSTDEKVELLTIRLYKLQNRLSKLELEVNGV